MVPKSHNDWGEFRRLLDELEDVSRRLKEGEARDLAKLDRKRREEIEGRLMRLLRPRGPPGSERRVSVRAPCDLEARVGSEGAAARVLDISGGGLKLSGGPASKIGQSLDVKILPRPGLVEEESTLTGQVVWVSQGALGISFGELGGAEERWLFRLVLRLLRARQQESPRE